MYKKWIISLIVVMSIIVIPVCIEANKQADKKLMIVAHPDDETIFAGKEIMNQSYFIVCITNGDNKIRKTEFQEIIKKSHNEGIILNFPDKTSNQKDDWKTCYKDIEKEIQYYLSLKKWDKVVTHNPDGEYGHIHHKMVNEMVTDLMIKKKQQDKLFYFEPYFKKSQKPSYEPTLTKQELKEKEELFSIYSSQQKTINKLKHITSYEKLIHYTQKDAIFR